MTIQLCLASRELLAKLEIEPATLARTVSPDKSSAYIAAVLWLTDYIEEGNTSIQYQIDCFLQACHHFCDAEAWAVTWRVLSTPLFKSNYRTLASQLDMQRLGAEQVALYSLLEGKLDQLANAHCLHGLGQGYYNLGEYMQPESKMVQETLEAAIRAFIEVNSIEQAGWALFTLGIVALYDLGDHPKAQASFEQAIIIFRKTNDTKGIAHTLHNLAEILNQQGQYEHARTLYEESLDILYNRLPEFEIAQAAWANLTYAKFLMDQNEIDKIRFYICRSIRLFKKLPVRFGLFWSYVQLGRLLIYRGRKYGAAVVLHRLSTDYVNLNDTGHDSAIVHYSIGLYGLLMQNYSQALRSFQRALTLYQEMEFLHGCCNGLEGGAFVAFHTHQYEISVRLLSVTAAIRTKINVIAPPIINKRNNEVLNPLRERLGELFFDQMWKTGQSMSIDEAAKTVMELHTL